MLGYSDKTKQTWFLLNIKEIITYILQVPLSLPQVIPLTSLMLTLIFMNL